MAHYTMPFENVACGTSADTFLTVAAIVAANTTGHRARVRSISIGPADDAPADANISVRLNRVSSVSGGGAGTATTVSAGNMGKKDAGALDTVITGGHTYTAEPTTYDTEPLWQSDMNTRGGIIKEWAAEDAPILGPDMLIGVMVAPKDTTARSVSGCIEFEQF